MRLPVLQTSLSLLVRSDDAKEFAENSKSKNTKRAYKASWQDFRYYCLYRNVKYLPASAGDVTDYIAFCGKGGLKVSTINVRLAAISLAHRLNGFADPTQDESVKSVMSGIRRKVGTRPVQKEPLLLASLKRIVAALPDNLTGIRDKAILLTHWAGAFRRNELMNLNVADLKFTQYGVTILLRRSKTDQAGVGFEKQIPYLKNEAVCPVRALQTWIERAEITDGPLFRKIDRWGKVGKKHLADRYAADLIKESVAKLGLDPRKYSGHSPRAGFVTDSAEKGIPALSIAAQTGQTLQTIARYQRSAGVVAREAVKKAFGE